MNRTEMRELAFKLIYSLEIQNSDNIEEQIELYFQQNKIENRKCSAQEKREKAYEHKERLVSH